MQPSPAVQSAYPSSCSLSLISLYRYQSLIIVSIFGLSTWHLADMRVVPPQYSPLIGCGPAAVLTQPGCGAGVFHGGDESAVG